MNELYTLEKSDFVKGAVVAVLTGVLATLYGIATQGNFDIFTANWGSILSLAVNSGVLALIGYLAKNFLSDKQGKVLGKIG